jgi:23S rRNA (pseudouridine1915-N3)-methyltransferase
MEINLICVGRLKETWWREACAEYAKRLQPFCRFSVVEVPECRLPDRPSQAHIDAALKAEGEKILSAAQNSKLFALCIEGKELSSERLSEKLESLGVNGVSRIGFAVGSSYGLGGEVKGKADFRLSMSPMTFPHQLARVMLCEQIYRSFQIIGHGKYHK